MKSFDPWADMQDPVLVDLSSEIPQMVVLAEALRSEEANPFKMNHCPIQGEEVQCSQLATKCHQVARTTLLSEWCFWLAGLTFGSGIIQISFDERELMLLGPVHGFHLAAVAVSFACSW